MTSRLPTGIFAWVWNSSINEREIWGRIFLISLLPVQWLFWWRNYWIQWSLLGVEIGRRKYLGGKFNAWTIILHFFTNTGSLDKAGAFEQMALSSPDFTKGNWRAGTEAPVQGWFLRSSLEPRTQPLRTEAPSELGHPQRRRELLYLYFHGHPLPPNWTWPLVAEHPDAEVWVGNSTNTCSGHEAKDGHFCSTQALSLSPQLPHTSHSWDLWW